MNKSRQRRSGPDHLRSVAIGKKLAKRTALMHVIAVAAVITALAYLIWRVVATSEDVKPILFWALWGAEFMGWISLALFVRDAWNQTPAELEFGEVTGSVAVFVPTYNEPPNVLEPTLMAASKIHGAKSVWLLDDGDRAWAKELAAEYGVEYLARAEHSHAKAGNINNALSHIDTEFVLILDADHVAMPSILQKTMGYFVDDQVALVQTPHSFRNLDSAQHFDKEVNEQSLFFDVLLPGRQRSGSVFWCGSGAVLRVSALREIGGLSTKTITEDLETTLVLNRLGYQSIYHNERLLIGLAPQNLAGFLIQRYRWARGSLENLLGRKSPIFRRGFKLNTRLSYLSNLIYYLVAIQLWTFSSVLVWSLMTGDLPVNANLSFLLFLWLPQLVLTLVTIWGLSGGKQLPFGGSRNAWVTSTIYARALFDTITRRKATFMVTPKEGVETGSWNAVRLLWLPTAVSFCLIIALILRLLTWFGFFGLEYMNPIGIAIATFFTLFELWILVPMLVRNFQKFQTRSSWREQVFLDAIVGADYVTVTDLHEGGLKFFGHQNFIQSVKVGDELDIEISLKTVTGEETKARGVVSVSSRTNDKEQNLGSVGGSVAWMGKADRYAVIEQCYLVEPLRSLK